MPDPIPLVVGLVLVLDQPVVFPSCGRERKVVAVALTIERVEDDADDVIGAVILIALHRVGANALGAAGVMGADAHIEKVRIVGDPEFRALGRRRILQRGELAQRVSARGVAPGEIVEPPVDDRRRRRGTNVEHRGGRGGEDRGGKEKGRGEAAAERSHEAGTEGTVEE